MRDAWTIGPVASHTRTQVKQQIKETAALSLDTGELVVANLARTAIESKPCSVG